MTRNKIKIPVITGPTASGKTGAALHLAMHTPIEIISADSRQVYRYMDIGTAKPTAEELASVKHYLIDVRDPDETFNAADFVEMALHAVQTIFDSGKIPLIAGGTGMYLWALENGLFDPGEIPSHIRTSIKEKIKIQGVEAAYNLLRERDPESAARIHPNDIQRISRALEIYEATGHSLSWWKLNQSGPQHAYTFHQIVLMPDRNFLYQVINDRVIKMIDNGLVAEVESLLKKGYSSEMNALKSVGYREVFPYLNGAYDINEMIRLIQRNTRHFAKRQMTWFKKYGGEIMRFSDMNEYRKILQSLPQKFSL